MGCTTSHLACVHELIHNLDTVNSRYRRNTRAQKFVGVQSALESAIAVHSPFNKFRAACFGRLAMELQREWIPMNPGEATLVERQYLRLMLLLFIAERLDGLENNEFESAKREATMRTHQCVSQLSRSK